MLPAPPTILSNHLLYLYLTLVPIHSVPSYCPSPHPYHPPTSPHPSSLVFPSPSFPRFLSSPELTFHTPLVSIPFILPGLPFPLAQN